MKRFLIGIAALTAACEFQMNDTHQYAVYIDPAFTPDRQDEIRAAMTEWNYASEGTIHLTESASPDGAHVIQVWSHEFTAGEHHAGTCVPYTETIEIQDNMKPDYTRRTALHELGHALGLDHDHENTIMCENLGCASKHLSCDDMWQFCRVWKCDSDQMALCQKQ